MKIFVAGGTGFLGRALVKALLARGDHVTVVSRRAERPWGDRVTMVRGTVTEPGDWQGAVEGQDTVVNLVGTPIVELPKRWTEARKALLRSSRVEATECVVDAIRRATRRPHLLVNQSAVGYYGDRGAQTLDEHATAGDDFLAGICVDWERAAEAAGDVTRVARLRTAAVVGRGGGVVEPMLPFFKLAVGGPWGPGTQWLPWVDLADWVEATLFVMDRQLDGPFNVCSPEVVTVQTFASTLGRVLGRPAILPVPSFGLKLLLGEQAATLLASQRVLPRRLTEAGFTWKNETLQVSLERSYGSTSAA